jgi:hypothetical protein
MRTGLLAVACGLSTAAATAQDWRLVEREHLQCVIDNAYVYQAEPEFPLVVIFDRCPDPSGA